MLERRTEIRAIEEAPQHLRRAFVDYMAAFPRLDAAPNGYGRIQLPGGPCDVLLLQDVAGMKYHVQVSPDGRPFWTMIYDSKGTPLTCAEAGELLTELSRSTFVPV